MKSDSTPAASSTESSDVPLVRVYHANRGAGGFQHGTYRLDSGGYCDVPEAVAQLWLNHKVGGMPAVVTREDDVTPKQAQLEQENATLKGEIEKTKTAAIEEQQRIISDAEKAIKGINEARGLAERKAQDAQTRIENLEKMIAELRATAAGAVTVPVVENLKPGETPNPQTVLTGAALKAEQSKVAEAKTPRK